MGGIYLRPHVHSKQIRPGLGEETTRSANENIQKVLTESGNKTARGPERSELSIVTKTDWQVCRLTQH